MKKILLISLVTVLAIGLVGCNNNNNVDVNNDNVIESGEQLENNDNNLNNENESKDDNKEVESGDNEENPEVKPEEENKEPEVKPEEDNREPEVKPEEDNKEPEVKPEEDNKEPEVKPEEDNKEPEVKPEEENKEPENNTESQEPENNEVEDNTSNEDLGNSGEISDEEENLGNKENDDENFEEEIVVSELEKKINSLIEKSQVMIRMPMAMPIAPETAFTFVGLTEGEFNANVADAVSFESMIMPANQSVCLLELKDNANVSDIKDKVLKNCDPNKWVCMSAEKCMVVDSGKYILLVMGTPDDCDALQKAFESEFGNIGKVLTK